MTATRHRGRSVGTKRQQLSNWVSGQTEFTMGQLARSLNWPLSDANNTLRRAEEKGEVLRVGKTRVPDAKRPVDVYQRACGDVMAMPLRDVLRVWS